MVVYLQASRPPGTSGTQKNGRTGTAATGLSVLSEGGESAVLGTEVSVS